MFSCYTPPLALRVASIVNLPVRALQDFSGDFSDLDGVVQQRRQEMMESSSSGSQTPDYDKITGVCSLRSSSFLCPLRLSSVSGVSAARTIFV